jgi:hypothetical protein
MTRRGLVLLASFAVWLGCGRGGLSVGDGVGGDSGAGAGAQSSGRGSGPANGVGVGGNAPGPSTGPGSAVGGSSSTMSGSMSGPGAGGSSMICMSFGDPCTDCASINCPETWCGCVNNQACLDIFQCFGACMMDPMCEQGCLQMHSAGISAAVLVSGCAGTTCSMVCDWGNPGFDPCQECIYTDCSMEMNACLSNPDCGALYQCLTGCSPIDLTCQQQCYLDYPGGVQLLEDALMCIASQCQSEC